MVNYYIFCHACYVPFNKSNLAIYRNPNISLFFDTSLNNESCSTEPQVNFETSDYDYRETYMSPVNDYILYFKDPVYSGLGTSLKLFGLFDEDKNRIQIKDITNGKFNPVLLSELLYFLVIKNEKTNIYCSFCRNACENNTIIPINQDLDFDIAFDDFEHGHLDDIDIDFLDNNDDEIDYNNIFKGGKRKTRSKKRLQYKRSLKTVRKNRFSKRKKNKKQLAKRNK